MLKNSYREENDFVISKNLQVLLIDKDSFLHYKIKKNGGSHITFDPVSTLAEATERLQKNNYDLILCDFSIEGVAAMFSAYSKKVPIVVLSTSDSTRDAQLAARMGAVDYIIKNDEGMKLIQRTLHTAFGQWRRKSKEKKIIPKSTM
jgi:CheY-like chemotaxis protein